MKYCKNCGKELNENQKYCDNCGTKIINGKDENTEQNLKSENINENSNINKQGNQPKVKIGIWNILCTLIPLALIIIIIYMMWELLFRPIFFPNLMDKYERSAEYNAKSFFSTWCYESEIKCNAIEEKDGIIIVKCQTTNQDVIDIYESNILYYGYKPSSNEINYNYYVSKNKSEVINYLNGNKKTSSSNSTNKLTDKDDNAVEKTKEDGIITTFYGNSYYMYVYVDSEKKDDGFFHKLNNIGSTWLEQYDGEKYILYVKKEKYDDVYNIIKQMDEVTKVEKTNTVVQKDNETVINSDNKYIMQVFAKIGEVTSREFYNLCTTYGEKVDDYTTEDMYVEVILVEEDNYDKVYNELSQNDDVERIINDKQTLEEYNYYAGME